MSAPPPPAQVERFRRDLEALVPAPGRLGLAVSGGPDSLALLLLAAAAYPGAVEAATVDHGLRAASAAEAAAVRAAATGLGCPHATLVAPVPDGPAGLQGEARAVRYDALRAWAGERNLPLLLTAHHADDQAETVLMRLRRGAGVAGLSGIRPIRAEGPSLTLVRPLLGWARADLAALVAAAGLAAADDPSNRDPRFDRARVRAFLGDHPDFEPARLARTAAACREADEALAWAAAELAEDRITAQGGEWRLDPTGLPRELRRRLLARAVAAIRDANGLPPKPRGEDVEPLLAALESSTAATLAGVMAKPGPCWHLRLAPPRRG
jgi:tRNA(Ile)-lysidine synthase